MHGLVTSITVGTSVWTSKVSPKSAHTVIIPMGTVLRIQAIGKNSGPGMW